jgi:sugar transferase (PEP-CTERM/EpsH1 system associated)
MSALESARRHQAAGSGRPRDAAGRPRIVQVIPSLRVGGLESVAARLVQHLAPLAEQAVVTPTGVGPLIERVPAGVSVFPMGETHRPDRWNAVRMARLFRTLRPDIVHTRNWTCIDAVIGARLAGVPVVIHGEHGREAADPEGRNRRRQQVRRFLSPFVTEFVTVSRDLARWLVEQVRVPARKVRTIYNGVDTERYAPGDRAAARQALGLPADWAVAGTVGRLDPVKDQVGLIRAFARSSSVAAHRGRSALVIVGDGPSRRQLEATVAELGLGESVRLLGERSDVPLVLRALDVFVLSSIGEGISNAILEAMATGLPVIATRVGGNSELVREGLTGCLIEPRRPEALAAALTAYFDDPPRARALGAAGRARAGEDFGLDRMLAGYVALYRQYAALEARP